jgi:TolB protein
MTLGAESRPARLTNNQRVDRNPTWSPDGSEIAFEGAPGPSEYDNRAIYVMNADGTGTRRLTSPNDINDFDPAWSPDGTQIAYAGTDVSTGKADIFVMNADGSQVQQLTRTPDTWDFGPTWSNDGEQIAFQSNYLRRMGTRISYDIWAMDADGARQRPLTKNAYDEENPSWSPDGNEIVFQTNRDRNPKYDLYYIDLRLRTQQQLPVEQRLTANLPGDHQVPNWCAYCDG